MLIKVLEEVSNLKLHSFTLLFSFFFFQNIISFHHNRLHHKNPVIIPSEELVEPGQELDGALPFLCLDFESEPLQFQGICISKVLSLSLASRPSPFYSPWRNWNSGIHSASELCYILVLCWLALPLSAYFREHQNNLCVTVSVSLEKHLRTYKL